MEPREAEIRDGQLLKALWEKREVSGHALTVLTAERETLLGWLDEARRERDDARGSVGDLAVLANEAEAEGARLAAALERIAALRFLSEARTVAREALQAGRAGNQEADQDGR